MSSFYEDIQKELELLKKDSLYRSFRVVDDPSQPHITVGDQSVLNLSSNNYLGIAKHPLLIEESIKAVKKLGGGATASRLMTGNYPLYQEVEEELARFKGTESALLFNSGYTANVGIITALAGPGDVILSDKLNHASIVDGILLSGAKFHRYRHRDLTHLEELLKKTTEYKRKLIITDSVFSMDGHLAPLPELVALKNKYGAILMIDEAHGGGVFGARGRGLAEAMGVSEDVEVNMGTFGKAFGTMGAYVAGKQILIDYLRNKARSLIFTTGLPPAVLGTIKGSLKVVQEEPWRRETLLTKAQQVRNTLREVGFDLLDSESQIIPIIVGDNAKTLEFSNKLLEENIMVVGVRPPTVPKNSSRLRLSLMATHTDEDLDLAVSKIIRIGKELKVI